MHQTALVGREAPLVMLHVSWPNVRPMRFVFRQPRFPVIAVVGDRVFQVPSADKLRRLFDRELGSTGGTARLLDSTWECFELHAEIGAIAPSFVDRHPPTKQALIELVNGRSNRAGDAPLYEKRALSARTRDAIFAELLTLLPHR